MANKAKIGLNFFPHDSNYGDDIKFIISKHKSVGYYCFFELCRKIYSDLAYYTLSKEKNLYLFSGEISTDIEKVKEIINDCIEENLFNKKLYINYQILTSKEIQETYIEICNKGKRKDIKMIKEYSLLDSEFIEKMKNIKINMFNLENMDNL